MLTGRLLFLCSSFAVVSGAAADERFSIDRCELIPQAEHRVSFRIDGEEKTGWHFGREYPRPFFYPFHGPSGVSLTRMGHPGAPNHDHHRGIWFAHKSVNAQDFWSDNTTHQIRQRRWNVYRDGNESATMAVQCDWHGSNDERLMRQQVVASLIRLKDGEHALEIQTTFYPPADQRRVELGKTNFGFLAVRVAKTLSTHFGAGKLTSSEGLQGESAIFGKRARWMDYSGPVVVGRGTDRKPVVEGITYFDHPDNPRFPTHWHVREDGWMGASFCMHASFTITRERPLRLRYLLHAHSGAYDQKRAEALHEVFSHGRRFEITRSEKRHHQFQVERLSDPSSRQ